MFTHPGALNESEGAPPLATYSAPPPPESNNNDQISEEAARALREDAVTQAQEEAWAAAMEKQTRFDMRVSARIEDLQVNDAARARLAATDRPDIPAPIGLHNLLLLPDLDIQYRIDEVMPRDGITLFSAAQKSGKTTLIGNLLRSLADGDRFLDQFMVTPASRVVLIDTESGTERVKRWLRAQRIENADAITVVSLRGAEGSLDVRDAEVRRQWIRILRGAEVVILDVVGPVLAALGLDENENAAVGNFWVSFRQLLAEAGVAEGIVVHHTGHNETRAIGASAWLRYPDAIWQVHRETEDPTSPRYFSAYGRDVDVKQGLLAFDPIRRRLKYTGESKTSAQSSRGVDPLLAEVRHRGGFLTTSQCLEFLMASPQSLTRKVANKVIDTAVDEGTLQRSSGAGRSKLIHLPGQVPAMGLHLLTDE